MADKSLVNGKYGVTELRLGQNLDVKVQDIQWGDLTELENGMFVTVDVKTGKMGAPTQEGDVWFVHSVVKNYERHLNSSDFINRKESFLPRLIRFGQDSIIATDDIVVDDSVAELKTYEAMNTYLGTESNKLYGYPDATSKRMRIAKTVPTEKAPIVKFEVAKVTTLKTGDLGLELVRL